jgi:hypothetical protein
MISMSRNGTSVIYNFTYYLGIVYVKLAIEQKFCGASTYLPHLEALCSEHIWNTHLANTTSNLRPRPSDGRKYNSYELKRLIRNLPKTWECSGSHYGPSEGLAGDLDQVPCFPYYSITPV